MKMQANNSKYWASCPGRSKAESLRAVQKVDDGELAHSLAEHCIRHAVPCSHLVGQIIAPHRGTVNKQMAYYVQYYVDHVNRAPGEKLLETPIKLDPFLPGGSGIIDAIAIDWDNHTLEIIDFKFGLGEEQHAAINHQAKLYACAYLEKINNASHQLIDTIKITIIQPRKKVKTSAEFTFIDILDYGDHLLDLSELAHDERPVRVASKKGCESCQAAGTCPERLNVLETVTGTQVDHFKENQVPHVKSLTNQQIADIIAAKSNIENFLAAVEDEARLKLAAGEILPGIESVPGNATRAWQSKDVAEAELVRLLGPRAYDKKLITPTRAATLLESQRPLDHLIYAKQNKARIITSDRIHEKAVPA